MRNIILLGLALAVSSCSGQVKDISKDFKEMNYVLARMYSEKPLKRELFNGGIFVTVFKFSDSKNTPNDSFKETDESLDSYLISSTIDGDSYIKSKLHKIGGLLNPKIKKIKELDYPFYSIEIEFGEINKRKIKVFKLKGI